MNIPELSHATYKRALWLAVEFSFICFRGKNTLPMPRTLNITRVSSNPMEMSTFAYEEATARYARNLAKFIYDREFEAILGKPAELLSDIDSVVINVHIPDDMSLHMSTKFGNLKHKTDWTRLHSMLSHAEGAGATVNRTS